MSAHLESFIQRDILAAVGARRDLKIWASKVTPVVNPKTGERVGGLSLPAGHPDLAGILRGGQALYVEVKSATGRLRPEQEVFGTMVRSMGGLWIVARSVQEVLDQLP